MSNVREKKWPAKETEGKLEIDSPDGYKFFLLDEEKSGDPVQKVALGASNLQQSVGELSSFSNIEMESKNFYLKFLKMFFLTVNWV